MIRPISYTGPAAYPSSSRRCASAESRSRAADSQRLSQSSPSFGSPYQDLLLTTLDGVKVRRLSSNSCLFTVRSPPIVRRKRRREKRKKMCVPASVSPFTSTSIACEAPSLRVAVCIGECVLNLPFYSTPSTSLPLTPLPLLCEWVSSPTRKAHPRRGYSTSDL